MKNDPFKDFYSGSILNPMSEPEETPLKGPWYQRLCFWLMRTLFIIWAKAFLASAKSQPHYKRSQKYKKVYKEGWFGTYVEYHERLKPPVIMEEEFENEIKRYKNMQQRKLNERIELYKKLAINEAESFQITDFICSLEALKKSCTNSPLVIMNETLPPHYYCLGCDKLWTWELNGASHSLDYLGHVYKIHDRCYIETTDAELLTKVEMKHNLYYNQN